MKIEEGRNLTTFLEVILAASLVFGFLPILSFLLITSKVPKEEILIFLSFTNCWIKISKKSSTIVDEKFLEKPSLNNASLMSNAAMLAGKAISISKTTAPHAVSYPFTALYNISHGHAVSLTFEKFLKFNYLNQNKSICAFDLEKRYLDIFKIFKVKNIYELEKYIKNLKTKAKLSDDFNLLNLDIKNNYHKILDGINIQRLKNNPILLKKKDIKLIILNKFY